MSEWRDRSIKDLCTAIVDCINKTAPSQESPPTPFKMLRTTNVRGGWVDTTSVKYVDAFTYAKWTSRLVPKRGDIILTREAPFGGVGMIRSDEQVFLGQRLVMYRADEVECDPHFLMYSMMGPVVQAELKSLGSGSTVEHLRVPDCEKITISCPPLPEQRRIGAILRSLDDLVENNRRRVEVLEEMARAIYREWFVKFRYPGHSDVPLVDSVLGPIPEGWGAGKIGDLCSRVQAGATPRRSTPEYWDEPAVDWYKTGDLTNGVLLGSSEKLSDAGLEAGRTFEPETILMAIYGSPTVGRLGLITSRASANQAALGLVADPDVCTTEYLWFSLESLRGHLNQIAQGAAQQNVSKEKVIGCDVLMPPREVMKDFTSRAAPGWRLSHELARQTAVLESLRDLLLPKLVTGQIDVSKLDLDALILEQVA